LSESILIISISNNNRNEMRFKPGFAKVFEGQDHGQGGCRIKEDRGGFQAKVRAGVMARREREGKRSDSGQFC
jgi:hypothetical protein